MVFFFRQIHMPYDHFMARYFPCGVHCALPANSRSYNSNRSSDPTDRCHSPLINIEISTTFASLRTTHSDVIQIVFVQSSESVSINFHRWSIEMMFLPLVDIHRTILAINCDPIREKWSKGKWQNYGQFVCRGEWTGTTRMDATFAYYYYLWPRNVNKRNQTSVLLLVVCVSN